MADNIYIGNRYVPLPMGAWDASIDYENFSTVIYTNGNGYIARKFVPAGTLPTDTNYWAFWGSSNAVTDALSNRMTAIENRTDNLEPRVDAAEQNIVNMQAELLNHDSRLTFVTNMSMSLAGTVENFIKTQGKLVAISTYGKTTGQGLGTAGGITVLWERVRAQSVFDTSISINNNDGVFTFNIPDPTKKYYLSVSANLTWSAANSLTSQRSIEVRNGTNNIVIVNSNSDVKNVTLSDFFFGEVTSATSLSLHFSGFPGDAVSFTDPGDGNFFTFKLWENLI